MDFTFLSHLGPTHTFICFDDSPQKRMPVVRYGTPEQHAAELARLNAQGFGVFVCVQGTTSTKRSARDIDHARALFIDVDRAEGIATPVPPSARVRTRAGREHLYWYLVPDQPLDAVSPALRRLIEYHDADPRCHDVARVLRVPGTLNCKPASIAHAQETGDPTAMLCTLVEHHPDRRYTIAQVIDGLTRPQPEWLGHYARAELERLGRGVTQAEQGDRNAALHRVAWQVKDWVRSGHLAESGAVQGLLAAAAPIVGDDFSWDEVQRTIVSAFKSTVPSDVVQAQVASADPQALQSGRPMDLAVHLLRAHGVDRGECLSTGAALYTYSDGGIWTPVSERDLRAWVQDLHGAMTFTDGKTGRLSVTTALRDQVIDLALAHSSVRRDVAIDADARGGVLVGGDWLART